MAAIVFLLASLVTVPARAYPPLGYIETIVGGGNGDKGPAINAIVDPRGLDICSGNMFIADGLTNRVRVVNGITGNIDTLAGTGVGAFGGDNGPAVNAQLKFPTEVACDSSGNVFVADTDNNRVRLIDASGTIRTYAGNGNAGSSGDGGLAVQASLWSPRGLALDSQGNLYIAEFNGNRVRRVTPSGTITTYAGNGNWGSGGDGGLATSASVANPSGLAVDSGGNLFIADYNNSKLRRVGADGKISTVAGDGFQGFIGDGGAAQGSRLKLPYRVRFDSVGNLYFLDNGNNRVRRLQAVNGLVSGTSTITTVAGNGSTGTTGDGGAATSASLWYLNGLALDTLGQLYLGLSTNTVPSTDNRVRMVNALGIITTEVGSGNGDGGPAINALIDPRGVKTDSTSDLYIADGNNNRVRLVDGDSGIITTIAGSGAPCLQPTTACGDGGLAINAQLRSPFDVARDDNGVVYIADTLSNRIRKVTLTGMISNFAGTGAYGYGGDNGSAVAGTLAYPYGISVTSNGSAVYVADFANNRVRKISNGTITTFAGTGNYGSGPGTDGVQATAANLASPTDVAIAPDGTIYIADYGSHAIRRVLADGTIVRVAGTGYAGYTGDGQLAVNAQLNLPFRITFDLAGNLYISDSQNKRVRRVDAITKVIDTVAGSGTGGLEGDGGPALLANLYRASGLAVDRAGHVFIAQSDSARVRVMSSQTGPTATPTPQPTATRPPTATATASFTSTTTPTASATRTPTSSATSTRTSTATPTWTSTTTATLTYTPTATPTNTIAGSPTATPTNLGGDLQVDGWVGYFTNSRPVDGVRVSLTSDTLSGALQVSTDTLGDFTQPQLTEGTWTTSARKLGGAGSAITALDATKVLQAAVGSTALNQLERFACDANGSGTITAIDASLILQLRVGLINALPVATRCNSDWLFVPSNPDPVLNQVLTMPSIDSRTCNPGGITFDPLVQNAPNQNFGGLLFGDCNGSWQPASGSGAVESTALRLGRPRMHRGVSRIPVYVDRPIQSLEAVIRYPSDLGARVTRAASSQGTILAVNRRTAGEVRIALASREAIPAGAVFYLTLNAERDGLSSQIHLIRSTAE